MTEIIHYITANPLSAVMQKYPLTADFLSNLRFRDIPPNLTLERLIERMDDATADEFGIRRDDIPFQLALFLQGLTGERNSAETLSSLTILGGRNKSGEDENIAVTLSRGDVAAIVGPTGSGKSRLLADIECLAQRDSPTGREILIDGLPVSDDRRFDMDGKLVAQLSQNMNFVMDLTVREFLEMHARSRFANDVSATVALCFERANELAGESFTADTKVTQLSGGQSRALMIADTAYMSLSPLVLVDEIENAGIDRQNAIRLLAKNDKIVLIATHDPLLALGAGKRIAIKNGGIFKVIDTLPEEKATLRELEQLDAALSSLRAQLRSGDLLFLEKSKQKYFTETLVKQDFK